MCSSDLSSSFGKSPRLRRVTSFAASSSFGKSPRLRRVDFVRRVESFRQINATPLRQLRLPQQTVKTENIGVTPSLSRTQNTRGLCRESFNGKSWDDSQPYSHSKPSGATPQIVQWKIVGSMTQPLPSGALVRRPTTSYRNTESMYFRLDDIINALSTSALKNCRCTSYPKKVLPGSHSCE